MAIQFCNLKIVFHLSIAIKDVFKEIGIVINFQFIHMLHDL